MQPSAPQMGKEKVSEGILVPSCHHGDGAGLPSGRGPARFRHPQDCQLCALPNTLCPWSQGPLGGSVCHPLSLADFSMPPRMEEMGGERTAPHGWGGCQFGCSGKQTPRDSERCRGPTGRGTHGR